MLRQDKKEWTDRNNNIKQIINITQEDITRKRI